MKQIPIYGLSKEKRIDKWGRLRKCKGIIVAYSQVDDEDFDKVNQCQWNLNRRYIISRIKVNYKWKTIKLHRFILNLNNSNIEVDHIDHNLLNNQKSNLRLCNSSENGGNRLKQFREITSKYKGVCIHILKRKYKDKTYQYKKYESSIRIKGNKIYLGTFNKEIDAAKSYNEAAIKYFGEFALLNDYSESDSSPMLKR